MTKTLLLVAPIPFEGARVSCQSRIFETKGITSRKVRQEKLCAFALLEKGFSLMGLEVNSLSPYKDDRGKWHFDGIEASITHTDGLCCAAISPVAVGVDAERLDRSIPRGLMKKICTTGEMAALEAVSDAERPSAAVSLWTQKEAVFKANGTLPFSKIDTEKEKLCRFGARTGGRDYIISLYPVSDIEIITNGVEIWPLT